MKLFAAIHVPEKFGFHLAFIDDFGLSSKKASNHPAGCGGSGFIVSGLRNGQLPLLREVEERAGERRGVFIGNSPLLNPLPARSSRGEEEAKLSFETVSEGLPYHRWWECQLRSRRAHFEALPPERRTLIRRGSQEIACSCRFGDRRSAFRDAA